MLKDRSWSGPAVVISFHHNGRACCMIFTLKNLFQWDRKFKKVQAKKNSWNQINQFYEILFWPNSIFCHFKNGQKSIFELGKSLKLLKMQFHEIFYLVFMENINKNFVKLVYLISRVFFCLDFFKFSGLLWAVIDFIFFWRERGENKMWIWPAKISFLH